jgi:hypothetical protein
LREIKNKARGAAAFFFSLRKLVSRNAATAQRLFGSRLGRRGFFPAEDAKEVWVHATPQRCVVASSREKNRREAPPRMNLEPVASLRRCVKKNQARSAAAFTLWNSVACVPQGEPRGIA